MTTATHSQAAAHLAEFFTDRVAEFLPIAEANALRSPVLFSGWLYRQAAEGYASQLGVIDEENLLFVASLSVPTLLAVWLDRQQPALVRVAACDALAGHFLADRDIKASIQLEAEGLARRAVQALAQRRQLAQVQAFTRAERQSLYGDEHPPVLLTREQVSAMDETAGVSA